MPANYPDMLRWGNPSAWQADTLAPAPPSPEPTLTTQYGPNQLDIGSIGGNSCPYRVAFPRACSFVNGPYLSRVHASVGRIWWTIKGKYFHAVRNLFKIDWCIWTLRTGPALLFLSYWQSVWVTKDQIYNPICDYGFWLRSLQVIFLFPWKIYRVGVSKLWGLLHPRMNLCPHLRPQSILSSKM